MQCQKHKELLEHWWNDQLTQEERADLRAQLAECEDCQRELEGSRELWDLMGYMPVPEPSGEMQVNFNAMLDRYKTSAEGRKKPILTGVSGFWQLFTGQPWLAAAFSLLLLAGGFGLGFISRQSSRVITAADATRTAVADGTRTAIARPLQVAGTNKPVVVSASSAMSRPIDVSQGSAGNQDKAGAATASQVQALSRQLREMRQMMMLSLLQNPSASERMRAATYADDSRIISPDILAVLLTTLNSDPNVNVRLTTLDALTQYARNPAVREGLIQSILQQDSPLMQAALADVMLKLQEKRSIQSFKKLLQEKGLNEMVRSKIEQVITRLT
jgi:hypothetical protein